MRESAREMEREERGERELVIVFAIVWVA